MLKRSFNSFRNRPDPETAGNQYNSLYDDTTALIVSEVGDKGAIYLDSVEGKAPEVALPDISEQWPAKDRTKTPDARP